MSTKHYKTFKKLGIFLASASLVAASMPLVFTTINSTKNNAVKVNATNPIANDEKYVPLTITDDSFTKNCVITSSVQTEIDKVDCIDKIDKKIGELGTEYSGSAWYTKSAHTETSAEHCFTDPDSSGNVTINSTPTTNLSWKLQNIGNGKNNSIQLSKETHPTATISFSNLGVYKEYVYLLATAANASGQTCELNATINYTEGDPETKTFTIKDWCYDPTESGLLASHEFYRYLDDKGTVSWNSNPYLCQCAIPVDYKRLIKNIEIQWGGEQDDMVLTVFAVSGVVANIDVPQINTPSVGKVTCDLSWPSIIGAKSYRLDVSTDSTFTTFLSGYNNKEINSTSTTIEGLDPNTTYYARVRSVDASSHQSDSSTAVSFTTGKIDATSIQVTGISSEMPLGTTIDVTAKAVGETIGGKTYDPTDPSVSCTTKPTGITIEKKPSSTTEYTLTTNSPCKGKIAFTSASNPTIQWEQDVTVRPNSPANLDAEPDYYALDISWDAVPNAEKYLVSVATDEAFTKIVKDYDKVECTDTNLHVSGLKQGTTYYYKVVTIQNNIESLPATNNTKTKYTFIPAPWAEDITSDGFTIVWDAVDYAQDYKIDIHRLNKDFSHILVKYIATTDGNTKIRISGANVVPDDTYYFRVKTLTKFGIESEWSPTSIVVLPPAPSTGLSVGAIAGISTGSAVVAATAIITPIVVHKNKSKKKRK